MSNPPTAWQSNPSWPNICTDIPLRGRHSATWPSRSTVSTARCLGKFATRSAIQSNSGAHDTNEFRRQGFSTRLYPYVSAHRSISWSDSRVVKSGLALCKLLKKKGYASIPFITPRAWKVAAILRASPFFAILLSSHEKASRLSVPNRII